MLDAGATNAKQLADLQHELETLERRQSSLEDSLLEVMERREELQTQQADELATIDALESELAEAQRARDDALSAIEQTRHQCVSRRDELTAGLDSDLVSLYERQRVARWPGCGTAAGPPVRSVPDRDRPRGARADLRRRRRRRAALPRVRRNPVAGQGRRPVKVIVEADGGSRGNPGPAGYGSVVWTADRSTVLAESKQAIGHATNNVAEYRGLIAGLEEAAKLGATEVEVRMDSKLVVEQMSGRWQVKHPDLRALMKQAKAVDDEVRPDQLRLDPAGRELARRPTGQRGDGRGGRTGEAESAPETVTSVEAPPSPAGWTGARGAPTRFLLLRHGQTELSTQRRYSGRGNPALTDVGQRQAEAAAQHLARARRRRSGHHVAAAARLRHRGEGRQGAGPRRRPSTTT